ncbi:MAG: tetratricopeptide repeat protein, partial [Terriglobia bacterium]
MILLAANLWLWNSSRPRKPVVPALLETPRRRRFRWAVHIGSGVISLAAVIVMVILSREAWAVPGIRLVFGCEAVISRVERSVAGGGHPDVDARLELADCYDERGRRADEVKVLEQLLTDQEVLTTSDKEKLPILVGRLHAYIGLDLLTSSDAALQTDAGLARQHLREAALRRPGDWFVLDLLAFATARTESLHPTKMPESRQILTDAQAIFNSMPVPPSSSERAQHWHWQGRALDEMGVYEEAEKAFAQEVQLRPADSPEAADARAFQHAAAYHRTGDLPALRRYLAEAPTPEDRGKAADEICRALIQKAGAADQQGDAVGAARYAKEAEDIWAIALQLGVVGQDRTDRVRTALLSFYSGRYDEAVSMWRQIVKEEPANEAYQLFLGWAARRAGLLEEARGAFEKYTAKRPDDPRGHSELGLTILGLAEKEGPAATTQRADLFRAAESEFRAAADLAPSDPVIAGWSRDAISERANKVETGQARIRSLEAALGWARKAHDLQPAEAKSSDATKRLANLLNNLAYHYLTESDDVVTARRYVDESLKWQPGQAYALDTKATILIRMAEKTQSASAQAPLLRT